MTEPGAQKNEDDRAAGVAGSSGADGEVNETKILGASDLGTNPYADDSAPGAPDYSGYGSYGSGTGDFGYGQASGTSDTGYPGQGYAGQDYSGQGYQSGYQAPGYPGQEFPGAYPGQDYQAPGYQTPGYQSPGYQAPGYQPGYPASGYGIAPGNPAYPGYPGYASSPKSKVAGALLAFFLGGFGAHNFYFGKKGKAVAQLILTLGSWIVMIAGFIFIGAGVDSYDYYNSYGYHTYGDNDGLIATGVILIILAGLVMTAVGIWAFVEFIMILIGSGGYDRDEQGRQVQ